MVETLRLDEDPDSLSNHYERLGRPLGFQLETETPRHGLEMLAANSLWCDDGFVPKQDFVKTLKEHYWAEVQTLDFRAPDSARKVNAWANEKNARAHTGSCRLSGAIFAASDDERRVLQRTMGGALRDDETKEEKFTLQDGASQLVPMMRQWGNFRYAERGGAQIVSLPYKGGMSMRVVLPRSRMPFPKFARS